MEPFAKTSYFDGEGRPFMERCIQDAFAAAEVEGVSSLVIFTASGEGPVYALNEFLSQDKFAHIKIIAVTPLHGRAYLADPIHPEKGMVTAGLRDEYRSILQKKSVPVISAHLPFKPIEGINHAPMHLIGSAIEMFGGGMALCIQSILVACDSGELRPGTRVIALTADTAILAFSSRTESFLSPRNGFLVEHIICRPRRYPLSKPKHTINAIREIPLADVANLPDSAVPLLEVK